MRAVAPWVLYLGMAVAMVSGATWPEPTWGGVAVGIAIVAAGIVALRRAGAPSPEESVAAAGVHGAARAGSLADGVRATADGVRRLADEAPALHLDEVRRRIETLQHLGPERVGDAQASIVARAGFPAYASVMAPLATAERLLWRAWSAAADGHRPECLRSLRAAVAHANEADALAAESLKAS